MCLNGIDAGKSPECPDVPARGDQWGVLKVGAVNPEGFCADESKTVIDHRLHNAALLIRDNDLLLSRANTFDLVGLVCHVTDSPHNLMLSDKTLRLRPNPAIATTRFLFRSLSDGACPPSNRELRHGNEREHEEHQSERCAHDSACPSTS